MGPLTIYLAIVGLADNILKPILMGRGLSTPMLVIFIGVLGGMIAHGIVGLFVGLGFALYGSLGLSQAAQRATAQIWNVPGVVRPALLALGREVHRRRLDVDPEPGR